MTQEFDPLICLLKLLSPCTNSNEAFELLSHLDTGQWDGLLAEAERQLVAPLLFSLMVKLNTSHGYEISQKEELHQIYSVNTIRNMLILHDAEIVLTALHNAGIPAAGLKGAYLLENVYLDIGSRSMNDIDLMVKKHDLPKSLAVMQELGYQIESYFDLADENVDTKHVPPMTKPGHAIVELHWTLLEEDEPFTIDAEALWQRAVPARIADVDALALGVEDLILHLCLHLTYQHFLNLGLRGLLDIALVIHNFRPEIDWLKLVRIAQSWGAERVTALTLNLVETQLNVPIPADVIPSLLPEGIEPSLLEKARLQLLERARFEDNFTPDMVELSAKKGLLAKVKIGFQRVFIPRMALARIYNVSPSSSKILWFYVERINYLVRSYGKTVMRLQRGEKGTEPARQKAEISISLHEWMKPYKK